MRLGNLYGWPSGLVPTLLCLSAFGQAPPIQQTSNTAVCSNIVFQGGAATFKCSGLSAEQTKILKDLPGILNAAFRREAGMISEIHRDLKSCLVSISDLKEGYWPRLNEDQVFEITFAASAHRGSSAMIYVPNGDDDHDRGKLAKQFVKALEDAHWETSVAHTQIVTHEYPRGIVVYAKPGSEILADEISKTLGKVVGVTNVSRMPIARYPFDTNVEIYIWSRP